MGLLRWLVVAHIVVVIIVIAIIGQPIVLWNKVFRRV